MELFYRGIKAALDDIRKIDKVARICTYLFVEIGTNSWKYIYNKTQQNVLSFYNNYIRI